MIDKYKEVAKKHDYLDEGVLVEVPQGWLDIVDQMFSEIDEIIKRENIGDFVVLQTKEKFGTLRVYVGPYIKEIDDIIGKYEDMSYYICCRCGKPATKISTGWICPFCDDCADKIGGSFQEINL